FEDMRKYVRDFLQIVSDQQNTKNLSFSYNVLLDDYNYLWFILNGKKIEDIIVGINAIGDTIHEKGFSRQLLAAVFEFTNRYDKLDKKSKYDTNVSDSNITKTQYLIYNYKRDKFYPFVPISRSKDQEKKRNNSMELVLMKEISNIIPFEKNFSYWYPIWNIPI
ncbi:MAG: PspA-associated protein PspAB, partial [Nitrososphaeraceae archaeon]